MVHGMRVENRIHILRPQAEGRRFLDVRTVKLADDFRLPGVDRFPAGKSLNATQATEHWGKLSEQIAAQGLVGKELVVFAHERDLLVLPLEGAAALAKVQVASPQDFRFDAA